MNFNTPVLAKPILKANVTKPDSFEHLKPYTSELFPADISDIKIHQRSEWGDCQLLAPIDALAHNPKGAQLLQNAFTPTDNGYKVKFEKYPDVEIIVKKIKPQSSWNETPSTISEFLLGLQLLKQAAKTKSSPGVEALEVGYAKLMQKLNPDDFTSWEEVYDIESGSVFKYHCSPEEALRDLTGWKVKTHKANESETHKNNPTTFEEAGKKNPQLLKNMQEYLNQLAQNPDKYIIVASAASTLDLSKTWPNGISEFHEYSIRKIDPGDKVITLANPYNNSKIINLPYSDFLKYFSMFTVAEVPN